MSADKRDAKRGMVRDYILLAAASAVTFAMLYFVPAKGQTIFKISQEYFIEMIIILPAVMILIGLFGVWISKEMVAKHLGRESGVKGAFLSILLGTLPTGPLYVAFPMAAALLRKGASVSNIVIFLSAWACIKIPQELVELQFLGFNFMATRLVLTVVFVILMGWAAEVTIKITDRRGAYVRRDAT